VDARIEHTRARGLAAHADAAHNWKQSIASTGVPLPRGHQHHPHDCEFLDGMAPARAHPDDRPSFFFTSKQSGRGRATTGRETKNVPVPSHPIPSHPIPYATRQRSTHRRRRRHLLSRTWMVELAVAARPFLPTRRVGVLLSFLESSDAVAVCLCLRVEIEINPKGLFFPPKIHRVLWRSRPPVPIIRLDV
jgi:hypothetical protein